MLMFAVCPAFSAVEYNIRDLGTQLGHTAHVAAALNDKGQVVGGSLNAAATELSAFLVNPPYSAMLTLDSFMDTPKCSATGINNQGIVCGSCDGVGLENVICVWNGKFVSLLPHLSPATYSKTNDINDAGYVVGNSGDEAYLYFEGTATPLLPLSGADRAYSSAVNSSGVVVGNSFFPPALRPMATTWVSGTAGTVPGLGGTRNLAYDIADNGWIVGQSHITGDTAIHAYLFEMGNTQAMDLGVLTGDYSSANATNGTVIVGSAEVAEAVIHAFIYSNGMMRDLNDLIPPESGWELIVANDVNIYGQICGYGAKDGATRAFLLTPHPPIGGAADWDLTIDDQGWTAATSIPPFEPAEAVHIPGAGYGLRATGFPCFAFLQSPEITLRPGRTYRLFCTISTTATTPDTAPQIRLRAFQTTTNMSELLALDSVAEALPAFTERTYEYTITTQLSGTAQTYRFYLDYTYFNPLDEQDAWVQLRRVLLVED